MQAAPASAGHGQICKHRWRRSCREAAGDVAGRRAEVHQRCARDAGAAAGVARSSSWQVRARSSHYLRQATQSMLLRGSCCRLVARCTARRVT